MADKDMTPTDTDSPPVQGVGESETRRGEDVAREEGKEAGRKDLGKKGQSDRPYGTSTARDSTGVDPQGPKDSDMPAQPSGDHGS